MRNLNTEASDLVQLLNGSGITVLRKFEGNKTLMDSFSSQFCTERHSKIVLCGINPGRLGAGKTGVPFLDFSSLSKILPNVKKTGSERSAQFFFEIVQYFGVKAFYATFHVTNVSSVGFD